MEKCKHDWICVSYIYDTISFYCRNCKEEIAYKDTGFAFNEEYGLAFIKNKTTTEQY